MSRAALALSLVALSTLVGAGSRAADEIAPEFESDIRALMEASGSSQLGLQVGQAIAVQMFQELRQSNPEVPDRAFEIIVDVVGERVGSENQNLIGKLIPIYAQHFTHDEIKELKAFYLRPLGRKLVKTLPELTQDSLAIGQAWAQQVMPTVRGDIETRFKAEGILEKVGGSPEAAGTSGSTGSSD